MKRIMLAMLLLALAGWLLAVGLALCVLPGPPGCTIESYLHRQSTLFICANEPRWGRLPL